MAFHPYLMFGGNCREAFDRYKEIFGGELFMISFKDMPSDEQVPAEFGNLIAHAAITLGEAVLMGSDDPTDSSGSVQGQQVNYAVDEASEAQRAFKELSDGGKVTVPIAPTSWSPMFGMCVDRFGTPWMVSTNSTAQP
jgi:PhnB protein